MGYGLVLMPMSSGALTVSFHHEAGRLFVRTYGGCITPREDWFGPFDEHEGRDPG